MTLDHLRCSWYKKAIQTRKRNYLREYIETDNNVFIIIVVGSGQVNILRVNESCYFNVLPT